LVVNYVLTYICIRQNKNIMKNQEMTPKARIERKYKSIEKHNDLMEFFIKEGDVIGENQQLDAILLLQKQINKLERETTKTQLTRISTKEQFDNLKVGDLFLKSNGRSTTGIFKVIKIKESKYGENSIYICYVSPDGELSEFVYSYTMRFKKTRLWGEYWSFEQECCTIRLQRKDFEK